MTHSCTYCSYNSKRRYNLIRHMIMVHCINQNDAEKTVIPMEQNVIPMEQNVIPMEQNVIIEKKSYSCEKCGKEYLHKKSLTDHLQKCNGLKTITCTICHKIFSSRQSKHRHMKKCSNTTETSTNNNSEINIFTQENIDYITDEFARKCFDSGVYGLNPMIDKIYFDKEHPENHNIELASLNHSLVRIKTDEGWTIHGLFNTLDQMITRSTGVIILKIKKGTLDPDRDLYKLNEIQNIEPEHKKKIRERTKGKLVARRENAAASLANAAAPKE